MIRLFAKTATTWTTQGLGEIHATRCLVTEERNGMYECELDVPITDLHYADIALGCLILVKPNPYETAQPFRIYQISRPMSGIVTINAAHISYDLSKIADAPFTASSCTQAMTKLASNAVDTCPFTFTTDKSVTATMTVKTPSSIRALLAGSQGSVLDVYGTGEWKFDGYSCYLYLHRGQDRGVTIRYGKNLTDLKQEENNAQVYSKLYPYWADSEGNLVTLPEVTLDINNQGNGTLVHDMSDKWDTAPTQAQLRTGAQTYINNNDLGTPVVNLTLSFTQISELIRDAIYLCDTVTVEFPALGVSAQAKVIKTVYNVLLDRYDEIEVGSTKQTFAATISTLADNSVTGTVGKTVMQSAIDRSTDLITGNLGGYIVMHDTNSDGEPDELLIMNTDDIGTATKVWRFNNSGLGYSSTGYTGNYGLAMTANGEIVADFITTGDLNAQVITTGILQDALGNNVWNLDTGEFTVHAAGNVQSIATYYAESINNTPPQWDRPQAYLFDSGGNPLYDADGKRLRAKSAWTTTAPTTSSKGYYWQRQYIVYTDGSTELTSASPMQDYYGRANLVMKMITVDDRPVGVLSGEADYMRFDAGQLEINSPQFQLDRQGNAFFQGSIVADSITLVGGADVPASRINGLQDATVSTINGTVTAGYVNALNITAGSVAAENITGETISGKRIQGGIIYYDDNNYWDLANGIIKISSFANQFTQIHNLAQGAQNGVDALKIGIAVDDNGVTVGRQDANIKGVFSNDSLEFQTIDNVPIAWFSSDSSEGLGVDLIQIGSHDTYSQRWFIRTSNNGDRLTFTRRAVSS